jgi:hypothetical protein
MRHQSAYAIRRGRRSACSRARRSAIHIAMRWGTWICFRRAIRLSPFKVDSSRATGNTFGNGRRTRTETGRPVSKRRARSSSLRRSQSAASSRRRRRVALNLCAKAGTSAELENPYREPSPRATPRAWDGARRSQPGSDHHTSVRIRPTELPDCGAPAPPRSMRDGSLHRRPPQARLRAGRYVQYCLRPIPPPNAGIALPLDANTPSSPSPPGKRYPISPGSAPWVLQVTSLNSEVRNQSPEERSYER